MKASVLMLVYNHEQYIAQALDSVLRQTGDFDYEVVIGEDCSTDGTRGIIAEFRERHPDKIRVVTSAENVGLNRNFMRTLQACRGQFVAMLEGDDYWTSPSKLSRQIEFLDSHPECAFCFHNVAAADAGTGQAPSGSLQVDQPDSAELEQRVREVERRSMWMAAIKGEISTLEDHLDRCYVQTGSIVFRNGLVTSFPDWFETVRMIDWPLIIMLAQRGKVGYINEVLGAYRIHAGGVWSGSDYVRRTQAILLLYDRLNPYLGYAYEAQIRFAAEQQWKGLAAYLTQLGVDQGLREGSISEVSSVFESWPRELGQPQAWQRQVVNSIYATLVFRSNQQGDQGSVRHWLGPMLRQRPAWLTNRGIWSIGARAVLGRWAAGRLASLRKRGSAARHSRHPR